jgi:anti-sigma regulatory factor (Ser/Thr protein kinase)
MARGAGATGHGHLVKVYEDDRDFVASVSEFLAAGIAAGDLVVVVATPAHRAMLAEAMGAGAIDVALDAREGLAMFMVDGVPDPDRFDETMGTLVRDAAPRHVRIFGEMVAVLWDEGNVSAVLALEELWNDLGAAVPFTLYCSYAMSAFERTADLSAIRDVCEQHGGVIGPDRDGEPSPEVCEVPDGGEVSELFMPEPRAIRAARRLVERTLRAWGDDELVNDALIVTSELATNAVVHGESPFRVSMSCDPDTLKLAIHDAGRDSPRPRDAGPEAANGRGLALVDMASKRWGTQRVVDGKIVWAQFDRSPS